MQYTFKSLLLSVSGAALLTGSAYATTPADCAGKTGCAKKICEIEVQIGFAQSHNNTAQATRLQAELAAAKANCSDAPAAAGQTSNMAHSDAEAAKLDKKIAEKQEDVAEAKARMEKAQAEGRQDKVMKYKHKMEEKQMQVQHLQEKKGAM